MNLKISLSIFFILLISCNKELDKSQNEVFIIKQITVDSFDTDGNSVSSFGLMNSKGKQLVGLNYKQIDFVGSDYFIGEKENRDKQYFRISNESLLFEKEFEDAKTFSDEGLARVKFQGKWGHINRKGDFVIPPLYDIVGAFSEGFASVLIENKVGFVNQLGQIVIDPKFDFNHTKYANLAQEINSYQFQEGLSPVIINGKYGFINQKGLEIIRPQYDFADSFYKGHAGIGMKKGGDLVYGIIDKTGKQIIEPKFHSILLDEEYFIGVYPDESSKSLFFRKYYFSYYNYDGSFKINGKYDFSTESGYVDWISNQSIRNLFSENLAFVCKGDSCGYINKEGELIIRPKYFPTINNAERFVTGLAAVAFNSNLNKGHSTGSDYKTDSYRPVGVIDKTGKIVIPPVFVSVEIFPTGVIKVIPKDDFPYYITNGELDRVFYTDYSGKYIWNGYTRK